MARLRTFIGIDPGKPVRDRLVSLQENLAKAGTEVKWVEPANLHLTLLFLGEVEDRRLPPVCQVVQENAAKHPAFAMTLATVGCFPNPRRPRILWVGVGQGAAEVTAVHDSLEAPLLELGCYRREERRYTPHLTLGRVKSDRPTDKLAGALGKYADWIAPETLVREVLVMSSELTPHGPVYTVLGRGTLAGSR
jgi:2'-5' RNA ligase